MKLIYIVYLMIALSAPSFANHEPPQNSTVASCLDMSYYYKEKSKHVKGYYVFNAWNNTADTQYIKVHGWICFNDGTCQHDWRDVKINPWGHWISPLHEILMRLPQEYDHEGVHYFTVYSEMQGFVNSFSSHVCTVHLRG